jgi:hypothetical protein
MLVKTFMNTNLFYFYSGVLHPVACTLSRLLEEPSLATTVIYTYILPLHVSAFTGHLQVEYTIFWEVTSLTADPLRFCYESYLNMLLANTAIVKILQVYKMLSTLSTTVFSAIC